MVRGPLERDTCRDYVLPALIAAGWSDDQIRPEFPVTAKRILTAAGATRDLGDGRVDYVLEVIPGVPVAVVEAKREYRNAADGLQQAVRYAQQLDVPLAYATNGDSIIERDMRSGRERHVSSFVTPPEAADRYAQLHRLDADGCALIFSEFNRGKRTASGDVVTPRWYQVVAIHRVLRAIARGDRRVLLLMATGTGKTFTAMQLVHKLRTHARKTDRRSNYRVLHLADRDILVEDPKRKDFTAAFGSDPLCRVGGRYDRSREIYFATYQALPGGRGDSDELFRRYRPDFFDVVIVDECHRGSASENSSWRRILDHFSDAVQVGLTATPKQDDTVDTYAYFGDPVFSYSLRQGIEDGFLAPYRVRLVRLSPDTDGWEPDPGQLDRYGREIPEGQYSTRDFERVVRLLARTDLAAQYLSRILERDPDGKMIIFCVDQTHADDMRRAMLNANPQRSADDSEWVVRIVGAETEKARLLDNFADPERNPPSPLVATTSRLLSTGVDIPDLKYVVIFRPVGSAVEFKQIVGRGTRLYPDRGKTSFEIIDFVGATDHFDDPDFDGFPTRTIIDNGTAPSEPADDDIDTEPEGEPAVAQPEPDFTAHNPEGDATGDHSDAEPRTRFVVDVGDFRVVAEAVLVPDRSTGDLVLTDYGEYIATQIRQIASSPDELAQRWTTAISRAEVLATLDDLGVKLDEIAPDGFADLDPLDVLVRIAWNRPTRTRAERARRAREAHHRDLDARSDIARAVLNAPLDSYAEFGVDEITSPQVSKVPPISDIGRPADIARALGDEQDLASLIDEVQTWIYDKFVS
uniref:EcoAI/FtnUII family type I restriction enzme subunit R n=1 Tax=Gordonia sp. B7-2 TaxID=3420932 RepID=UPI003D89BC1F